MCANITKFSFSNISKKGELWSPRSSFYKRPKLDAMKRPIRVRYVAVSLERKISASAEKPVFHNTVQLKQFVPLIDN